MGELIPFKKVCTVDNPNQIKFALSCALAFAKETTDLIWVYSDDIMLWATNVYPGNDWVARVFPGGRIECKRELGGE